MEKSFQRKNHSIKIETYSNFIKVNVYLSSDLYFDVVITSQSKGSAQKYDYERFVLNDFKQHVFNESYPGQIHFSYAEEFYEYMKSKGIDVENGNNNGWYNTVCFEKSSMCSEQTLLNYIEQKSATFESVSYRIPK
jgi:hypothetical protein